MKQLYFYISVIFILLGTVAARADKITTFAQVEDVMIYNDYNKMKDLEKHFSRSLMNASSVEDKISLNQTVGLLNLHMGHREKARNSFLASLELHKEFFPEDSLKIYPDIHFYLLSLSENDIDGLDAVSDILTGTPESSHHLASLASYLMTVNYFDDVIYLLYSAKAQAENEMEQGRRWARLNYMMIMDSIISAERLMGNYENALKAIEEFQTYLKSGFSSASFYYISAEIQKAQILCQIGNFSNALDALESADALLYKRDVVTGILKARSHMASGDIWFEKGSYDTAAESYKSAKRIWTYDIYDRDAHIKVMNREMECHFKNGDKEKGDALDDEIEKLIDASNNITELINYIRIISESLIDDGLPSIAVEGLNAGLDLVNSIGADYDNTLKLKSTLAHAFQTGQDYEKAAELFSEIIADEKQRAHDILAFLPEGQRELYWKKKAPLMDDIFRLNQEGTMTAGRGKVFERKKGTDFYCSEILYDASLLNKGLLLEAFLNMQRTILESGDRELIDAFHELRRLQGNDPKKAEELEKTIISRSSTYGDYMDFTKTGWQDVRDGLAGHEAAIEFVVSESNGTEYYSAEVLRSHYVAPQHVFLFACDTEDNRHLSMDVYSSTALHKKIWGRLESQLEGCSDIYFAPAGDFYSIAIEYLPVNETQRMNDIYRMHRLSSTKSLAGDRKDINRDSKASAVLYGGLDYNLDTDEMEYYAHSLSRSGTLETMNWAYLKGTEEEVRNISCILDNHSCVTRTFTAGEGVEESFKILSGKSPEIIHVATHGFFIEDGRDMLRNTGLVFAGANNHNASVLSADDGLLTSHEISSMDLTGAELVVLSACQTALGTVSSEGVFGLQRGFKKACAKTILMSLWEVDDQATSELMTSFYTNLASGMGKSESLYAAQKHVMKVCGTDPSLWAGFIILD